MRTRLVIGILCLWMVSPLAQAHDNCRDLSGFLQGLHQHVLFPQYSIRTIVLGWFFIQKGVSMSQVTEAMTYVNNRLNDIANMRQEDIRHELRTPSVMAIIVLTTHHWSQSQRQVAFEEFLKSIVDQVVENIHRQPPVWFNYARLMAAIYQTAIDREAGDSFDPFQFNVPFQHTVYRYDALKHTYQPEFPR